MKKRFAKPGRAGTILGVVALVVALTGTAAVAGIPGKLKLGNFDQSSRDRLAGTGVIQYASQTHTVNADGGVNLQTFTVNCELAKKASAGGFKWAAVQPPASYKIHDAYPTGGGFVVRLYYTGAAPTQLSVYANCVKSRMQRDTPPS